MKRLPRRSLTWLLLLSMLFIAQAQAEAPAHDDDLTPSQLLSLHQVLEQTIARYPDTRLLDAKRIEIEARAKHARGPLPFAPAVGFRNQNDVITSGRGEREWEADVELPFWLPGQRAAREAIAQDAQQGYTDAQDNLALQVAGLLRDAVWDIAMTAHQATLAVSRHETALALLNDVERRFKAGDLAKTDVMLAQNEAYQAETARIRADAEVKHAQFRYKMLTGLKTIPTQLTETKSIKTLDEQHPSLRDAAKKVLVANDERNLVQVERRENPAFYFSARSQRGAFDNQANESLGFKVRIPLDSATRSAPLIANAEMNLARNQSEEMRLRYALETAFHEAEHNLEVTQAELEVVARQQANAQESLRLAKKSFALGESDLVNLLRVQALAYEAERALRQREIQLQWDTARFNQAVGDLP